MNFSENFRIALRALAANKLRSALTMLGVVIGVASVIAMVAIGTGAGYEAEQRIKGLGAHVDQTGRHAGDRVAGVSPVCV